MTTTWISFTAAMTAMVLRDEKVETRRQVKPQPVRDSNAPYDASHHAGVDADVWIWTSPLLAAGVCHSGREAVARMMASVSPYGQLGDRLKVLEPLQELGDGLTCYAADREEIPLVSWRWKHSGIPGRFMPRGLCRLELEVTSVHVERLSDITDAAIRREGVTLASLTQLLGRAPKRSPLSGAVGPLTLREMWFMGWEKLHGAESRVADPWLWCVGFRRI